ncbi:hypothetical protein PIB30_100356, partial [Stylosanthes scabra]|nr:hypothetical protein [Stylosanthes scabra]
RRQRQGLESREQEQDKQHLLNNLLNNILNNHPNSNNNKTSLQVSILTLTPPCPKFKGGLTNNTKKIGEALRPLTQEWIEWMINRVSCVTPTKWPMNKCSLFTKTQLDNSRRWRCKEFQ